MAQIKEQRRRQLEKRKEELLERDGAKAGAEVSKLKDTFDKDLADMEAALVRERQQQLARLRKAKLARKIAKEKKRKEQEAKEAAEKEA